MLSSKRTRARPAHVLGPLARVVIIAFAASAAGCSSDITRFSFNGPSQTTSSIPVPPEPVGNGYAPASHPRGLGLTEAPLPPVSEPSGGPRQAGRDYGASPPPYQPDPPPRMAAAHEPSAYPPSYQPPPSEPPGNYRVVGRQYKMPPPQAPTHPGPRVAAAPDRPFDPPPASAGGQTVEVQPGETLYSIGRRYGVPADAIKEANGLPSNVVRPGVRLVIPASAPDRGPFAAQLGHRGPVAADTPAPAALSDRAPAGRTAMADAAEQPGAEPPPPGWSGRHTLRNGESLSAVAIRHKVSLEDLKRANGITDPAKVWAGTVLHVPEQTAAAAAPVTDAGTRASQTPPRIINAAPEPERKVASRGDVASDADAETVGGKFRWPVRGRVIAGFGRRPDGTHNDGVNVAVPQGTEVQAAESGKVVYAGNELKGYGNLVLIRHPNGWVTAYAHADRLLVKNNDEVRRGQAIATAGRTGSVDQPQLHFELRQGSKPVDPVPHLAN